MCYERATDGLGVYIPSIPVSEVGPHDVPPACTAYPKLQQASGLFSSTHMGPLLECRPRLIALLDVTSRGRRQAHAPTELDQSKLLRNRKECLKIDIFFLIHELSTWFPTKQRLDLGRDPFRHGARFCWLDVLLIDRANDGG